MANLKRRLNSGFSLLEMTVVLAIVSIMTAIILFNLPQMKGGLSIDVVAQEVAIYIRGAQVYSRATKSYFDSNSAPSYSSFGIHFYSSVEKNKKFFLWADGDGNVKRDKNYLWDESVGEKEIDPVQERYELPKGFTFSSLGCVKNGKLESVNELDIVFQLPDPEANFGGIGYGATNCLEANKAIVCLKSPNLEQYRVIQTYNNGQIMVSNPTNDVGNPCSKK